MKIGVYCRVSGISQKENTSLENQRLLGVEFCKHNNFEYEVFTDVESGTVFKRKEFTKLLNKCREGKLNGLWVYDNDRLGRDVDVSGEIRSEVVKHKLRLFVNFSEVKFDDANDRLNYNLRSVINDFEKESIKRRMNYGKRRKYQMGSGLNMLGFGYSKDKFKNIIIVEKEKEIIEDIYKTYLRKDVKTFAEVKRRIVNKYGKVVNGRRITESRIGVVLRDKKYLGKVYRKDFMGDKYVFDIGRIISDELYQKVQNKKGKKSRGNFNKIQYLLKGKVKCGSCGSNMWVKRGGKKLKNGKVFSYYYCNSDERKRKYEKKFNQYVINENTFKNNTPIDRKEYESMYGKFTECDSLDNNTINVEKLEELVWFSLYDLITQTNEIKEEYKKRHNEKLGGKKGDIGKLRYYEKQLDKIESRIDKLYTQWLDGEMDSERKDRLEKEYKQTIDDIKQRIFELKESLSSLDEVDNIDNYIDLMKLDLEKEFNKKKFEERRKVIEKYLDEVTVKLIDKTYKRKVYEIVIKLNYTVGEDRRSEFKLGVGVDNSPNQYNNPMGYKLGYELAQSQFSTYNAKVFNLGIKMTYKYTVTNMGINLWNKFINKRDLIKVE